MPKYLQVFFSKDEKKELARLAVELDTNMTAIVRQAVQEFLIKHKTEMKKDEGYFINRGINRAGTVQHGTSQGKTKAADTATTRGGKLHAKQWDLEWALLDGSTH